MIITSTQNPHLVEARKLTQRKYRVRQNRFLVEGLQLLALAVQIAQTPAGRSRVKPLELFYSEDLFTGETAPRLLAQLTALGAAAIPVAPHVLDSLSERDTSQGLTATFALRELEYTLDNLLIQPSNHLTLRQPPNLLLILDQLQDPGNLGTLIRTADAAGARAVILLEPCVDPFDPKTVRGTMGSLFTVPFARAKNGPELWARLVNLGYRLVGADAPRGQTVWQSDALTGAVALVLGNEARGLSAEAQLYLADYVSLPLIGQAESLNVAIAGGVLMYEWLRRNLSSDLSLHRA